MLVKIHESKGRKVIAICDEDLIGKTFADKNANLFISEHFYKGEKMGGDELLALTKNCSNLNIVGKKSIAFALKHHLIAQSGVLKIGGVPYANVIEYW